MRVLAGALKGQRLTTPRGRTTRPTADQVRIACLDTLMPYLEAGPFLDLFAGAGGLSLGFEQAGFDVCAAVEIDPVHCAAHKFNFPDCAVIPRSVVGLGRSVAFMPIQR